MTTLITALPPRTAPGAVPTGPIGRRLAQRLRATGEAVRVLAPRPETSGWPDGAQVIDGDITRPQRSSAAFDGVDQLLLAGAAPDTVTDVVDRAVAGGVRRIVVLSSHGPEFEVTLPPQQWYWLAIERAVEASSARWTHLRPSAVNASMLPEGCPYPGASWAELIRTVGSSPAPRCCRRSTPSRGRPCRRGGGGPVRRQLCLHDRGGRWSAGQRT
jgi:putative NAD(P)-binding protein